MIATLALYLARNDGGFCHFEPLQKAKNPYFKKQICTLNLWILRQRLSMTRNSSLREFAKRERANSWQSTENFCGVLGSGWLNF